MDMNSKVVIGERGILEEKKNRERKRENRILYQREIIKSQIFRDPFRVSKDLIQSPPSPHFFVFKKTKSHTPTLSSSIHFSLISFIVSFFSVSLDEISASLSALSVLSIHACLCDAHPVSPPRVCLVQNRREEWNDFN